jgi:hypothetical protein
MAAAFDAQNIASVGAVEMWVGQRQVRERDLVIGNSPEIMSGAGWQTTSENRQISIDHKRPIE